MLPRNIIFKNQQVSFLHVACGKLHIIKPIIKIAGLQKFDVSPLGQNVAVLHDHDAIRREHGGCLLYTSDAADE